MSTDDLIDASVVGAEGQESGLLKDLRRQLKEREAKLKLLESKEEAFDQVRAALAENLLMEAGYPGLKNDVLEKIEGVPSKEDVDAFLKVRGLEAKVRESDGSQDVPEEEQQPDVAEVAGLGQQVASAAQRKPLDKFTQELDAAKNQWEIDAVMAKHGLRG